MWSKKQYVLKNSIYLLTLHTRRSCLFQGFCRGYKLTFDKVKTLIFQKTSLYLQPFLLILLVQTFGRGVWGETLFVEKVSPHKKSPYKRIEHEIIKTVV